MTNKKKIFAIYKKGIHLGNEKGNEEIEAINNYITSAYVKEFIDDKEFTSLYTATIAVKGFHY